jgi:glycosyltransferase involved in cell wall biosynthesis
MHIVYLHQYFATPSMPDGTRSYEMARRLVAAGHRVSMVASYRHPTDRTGWYTTQEAGIEVHWLPVPYSNKMTFVQRLGAFLRFAVSAARRAAMLRADVVYATSTPLTIAIPGAWASWRMGVPMVFEVRDMWPDVPIAMGILRNPVLVKFARMLELFAYRRARYVVALAPGMRDDIAAKGVPDSKLTVIPNGCDNSIFGAVVDPVHSPRRKHAWLGDRPMVIYPGAIGRVNGVGYLVEVAKACQAIDPEIRFVVIGGGSEWDAVREHARQAKVLDTSFFMLPAMPKNDLAHWVIDSNLLMCLIGPKSVSKDAVQNKFFDAMAAGKPTGNNFEGFQTRIAIAHDIGIVMDPEDTAAGARLLVSKLRNTTWLDGAAARSRALATGEFSRDVLATKLQLVLEEVVARSNGGPAAAQAGAHL